MTGANRGIGLEFSRQYAADGWRVLACSRNPEKSEALNNLAAQYPDRIKVHALDVADLAQIDHLAKVLSDESIDLLVNNAGIYPQSDRNGFGHTDYADWMLSFRVNSMAPLKMVEAFISHIARGRQKVIVTITSKMGSIADNRGGGSYLYRSSKVAANMVVRSLAIDLKPMGITAVLFHPGWVKTDMGGQYALLTVEQSVSSIRKTIDRLTPADSGKFFECDGRIIPW